MYTLGLGSFLGDFADRYTPEEVQYGTSEEVNRRQKTENLLVKLPTDIVVSSMVSSYVSKQVKNVNEKRNLLDKWGTAADGTNQGEKHFYRYWETQPKRISSLENRLGVPEGTFENSPEGFKNFTEQAERVVKEAKKNKNVRNVNGKSFYYIDGADKVKKGVAVVVEDGKLQSMILGDIRLFHKLVLFPF